jgi:TonB-dependent starch-binding outer membrane protein SusC
MTTTRLLRVLLLCPLFMLIVQQTWAQNKTVSGKVSDEKGNPVSGASVLAKGTSTGTSTDATGTFKLSVPQSASVLVVSYVGYVSQEVSIASTDNISVTLQPEGSALTDVVVVGYGTVKKKDLTGAVASVKEKDFNKGVFTAPDQLIQGKAAGVLVINNSGQPGGATTVRIRGTSSIRSGNQPLYVVDGVPLAGGSARPGYNGGDFGGTDPGNPLAFINPNDISSMEILKDASATAIYGSRGANGVIIITTKRGLSGTPKLEVAASTGVSNLLRKLEVLSGDEYRKALQDYGLSDASDFGESEDAFDAITRTGITQNYSLSMSGGNENGRYRVSAGYLDQKGILYDSELKKLTAGINGSFKFLDSKRLGLDFNLQTAHINEGIAPVSNNAGFTGNLIAQALQWNPTHALKYSEDSIWIDPAVGATTVNPLKMLEAYDDHINTNTIIASIAPSFKILKNLEYKVLYSAFYQVGERRNQVNSTLNNQGIQGRGFAALSFASQLNQQVTNTLNYNTQLSKDLDLNAVVGHEWLIYDSKGYGMTGQDFINVGLDYYNFIGYSTINSRNIYSYISPTTELQSFFGRAILNYKSRYLLTATIRRDGSTKFGENNKYGNFPSLAFGWNVSNEEFFKGITAVNNLKFRVGWGKTGNQEFNSGASLNRFVLVGNNGGISQTNYGNPDLQWESSETFNIGLDFGLFNNRISGSVDYFNKKQSKVLYEQTLVLPAPPGKIWINLPGNINNKGLELSINAAIVNSKDFTFNLVANATFIQNEVTGLRPGEFYETGLLSGQGISGATSQRIINDQPLNVYYLRNFEGIDKTTGQSLYTDDGNTLYYSGSPNPKTLLGLSADFSYKKFSLVMNMNGSFGHYLYNNTANSVVPIGNLGTRNIAKSLLGGDVVEDLTNPIAPSTRYLEKGNYLKMANASISYRVGNIGKSIKNLNISLTGQNLFVLTNYTGFDPEVNTDKSVDGVPSLGIEYIPYPSARNILIGVSFSL